MCFPLLVCDTIRHKTLWWTIRTCTHLTLNEVILSLQCVKLVITILIIWSHQYCHLLGKQVQKPPGQTRSLKAKGNHSLRILFRMKHHTGAWVHWRCQTWLILLASVRFDEEDGCFVSLVYGYTSTLLPEKIWVSVWDVTFVQISYYGKTKAETVPREIRGLDINIDININLFWMWPYGAWLTGGSTRAKAAIQVLVRPSGGSIKWT